SAGLVVSNYSANSRRRFEPTVYKCVFTHSGPEAVAEETTSSMQLAGLVLGMSQHPLQSSKLLPN
ncbi:hypothetical protein, partial [uncultured Pseudomonas sp.]|uniref:hypothetical protein n=1 Tax=uncultured Pseudomonas sp. TaxID=114707 RepID=UPI002805FD2A